MSMNEKKAPTVAGSSLGAASVAGLAGLKVADRLVPSGLAPITSGIAAKVCAANLGE